MKALSPIMLIQIIITAIEIFTSSLSNDEMNMNVYIKFVRKHPYSLANIFKFTILLPGFIKRIDPKLSFFF